MNPLRWITLALPLAAAGALHGQDDGDAQGIEAWLAHAFSGELRRAETRLEGISAELKGLPELLSTPFGSRYGYRSEKLESRDEPQWVQIDLGRSWPIDRIAAVPAHIPALGKAGEGFGFPLRFRIEVAGNPEMAGAVTVLDRSGSDVPNPGCFPMDFVIKPTEARYVRFTSTRHAPLDDGFFWALEELVILSGANRVDTTQITKASSSLELFPNWSASRINDGQSALGMPVTMEKSPTRGYASALTHNLNQAEKWIEVDLGAETEIDEVRLLPVVSENFEAPGWESFPRKWRLELSDDSGFGNPAILEIGRASNLPGYPGQCGYILQTSGERGRYLRLIAEESWGIDDLAGFALAEIQAYSGARNIALGKPVRASGQDDTRDTREWSPAAVVDGFNSTHRLIEYPEYLGLIGQRRKLEAEQLELIGLRERKIRAAGNAAKFGGVGLGASALLAWTWMLRRQKMIRSQAIARLRDQISRDLHDDIGSNLGGIVLLSEIGGRHCADAQAKEDFKTIREAAETTSQSMQDIVWLIERENIGLRELVTRMRHSAEILLGENTVSFKVSPADFPNRPLSLFFRRHAFFAFKETINNARKHSGAAAVGVDIRIEPDGLRFEIRDDGCGFDMERASQSGHGLANLRRRAERVKGTCNITSSPGKGTLVAFTLPFKSSLENT